LNEVQAAPVAAPQEALSGREAEVLCLLAQGHSNKQIANRLHIGETTVKSHVSNVLAKLGMASRTQAALYAVQSRLVSQECFGQTGDTTIG